MTMMLRAPIQLSFSRIALVDFGVDPPWLFEHPPPDMGVPFMRLSRRCAKPISIKMERKNKKKTKKNNNHIIFRSPLREHGRVDMHAEVQE